MNKKLLSLSVMFGILFLSACQNSGSPSGSSLKQESAITPSYSSDVQQSSDSEIPPASQDFSTSSSAAANIYRYDDIPAFPIPKISPQKISYYKVMLGETSVILDTEQIEQVTKLLSEVEIKDAPTKKEPDAELHQVIGFYQNVDDEEPAYSLYFLVDYLYIETNGTSSDAYPTLNWTSKDSNDESKIDIKLGRLINSWARPGFPPLL